MLPHSADLAGPYRALLALAAGIVTVPAFAPFSFPPLALIGPAVLFWLWLDAGLWAAFREGWLFGLGMFGVGVFWMHISIDQFGGVSTTLAILITFAFVAIIALYYGLAGWLAIRLGGRFPHAWLLIFPALWVLMEWLRGWLLSGFPWLAMGYSQTGTLLQGFAPLLGVYGVSLVVVLSSALLLHALRSTGHRRWVSLTLVALLYVGGWGLDRHAWTWPVDEPLRVSLIQGNVPQEMKWKREELRVILELYTRLTRENWASDLIIWPETAVPAFYHQMDKTLLTPLAREAEEQNSQLLIGIPVWQQERKRYFNAMATLGGERAAYYKRHLVPFGEFMPLEWLLKPLIKLLNIPMSNFSSGNSERPLLWVAGYPAGISICYEDAFGEEVSEALPEAAFLVNASNDAWFGDSLAPHQHLQIARMRSLETGRYMLRATNTGISALIDAKGELIGVSPPFEEYVLNGEIRIMEGVTPYVWGGNWMVVGFSLGLLLLGVALGRRRMAKL